MRDLDGNQDDEENYKSNGVKYEKVKKKKKRNKKKKQKKIKTKKKT